MAVNGNGNLKYSNGYSKKKLDVVIVGGGLVSLRLGNLCWLFYS